jgi:hypothetical protein
MPKLGRSLGSYSLQGCKEPFSPRLKRESGTVDRSHQVDFHAQRHLPLVDLLVDTRAELMELAVVSGLKVLYTMLEDDRTAVCGLRYQHQVGRQASTRGNGPE